mgnify:CR=1 FL=1
MGAVLVVGVVVERVEVDDVVLEYGHPLSGAVPQRDASGRLACDEHSSLVFVLVPGGESLRLEP